MKITYRTMIALDTAIHFVLVTDDGRLALYRHPIDLTMIRNAAKLEDSMKLHAEKDFGESVNLVSGEPWDNIKRLDGTIQNPVTGDEMKASDLVFQFHNLAGELVRT